MDTSSLVPCRERRQSADGDGAECNDTGGEGKRLLADDGPLVAVAGTSSWTHQMSVLNVSVRLQAEIGHPKRTR
jgi:hypothetical protein